MKKVLLIVIDALDARVVDRAFQSDRLPALKRLAAYGSRRESVSIFPSITPAATCSLITGRYPKDHGIAGAHWFDEQEQAVAYFGTDIWAILERGVAEFFNDLMVRLNHERLRGTTLYQEVERRGMRAACLNYLWYRGDVPHQLRAPLLMRLLPGVPWSSKEVLGPSVLCLGDFVTTRLESTGEELSARGGLARKYGFHDETTADFLRQLIEADAVPDLTVAYFPQNDFESHEKGPFGALPVLQKVDSHLAELFESAGGLETLLEQTAVIVTGDHGQVELAESEDEREINLGELFEGFDLVPAGDTWSGTRDLMVCPNMRSAQVYLPPHETGDPQRVVEALLASRKVDQVITQREHRFSIATGDRGLLEFWRSDSGTRDDWGNRWEYRGDLQAIDACVDDGTLRSKDYPNALERIEGSFVDKSGKMWATARPGFEFRLPKTSVNQRGSHGALHRLESLSPLIAAGMPEGIALPDRPRSVDVAPLCLRCFAIEE